MSNAEDWPRRLRRLEVQARTVGDLLDGLARGFDQIADRQMTGADVAAALRESRDELVTAMLDLALSSEGEHDGDEHGEDDDGADDEHDRNQ